jgi:hypothetical protein
MLAKYCTSRSSLSYCFGRPVFLFSLFNARILPILHQLIKKQDTPSNGMILHQLIKMQKLMLNRLGKNSLVSPITGIIYDVLCQIGGNSMDVLGSSN